MKQKIDFLKSAPKTTLPLFAKWITLTAIASIVLLTLISLNMAITQIRDNMEVNRVDEESIAVTTRFQNIVKKYPLLAGETPLAIQIGLLEKELEQRKQEYAILTRAHLRYGFSNYLTTLARVAPVGLWLKQITIDQEKKSAVLSGYMVEPVNVSLLLQALQDSPTFAGTSFNVFYLQDMPDKPYTSFSISNKPLKPE